MKRKIFYGQTTIECQKPGYWNVYIGRGKMMDAEMLATAGDLSYCKQWVDDNNYHIEKAIEERKND